MLSAGFFIHRFRDCNMYARHWIGCASGALLLGTTLFGMPGSTHAASAIMADQDRGVFGYCTGQANAWAAMTCAQEKCEKGGGKACNAVEGCPKSGYGAIARNADGRQVAGSCGTESEAAARDRAMQRCQPSNGVPCRIVATFQDDPTQSGDGQQGEGETAPKPTAREEAVEPPAAKPKPPAPRKQAAKAAPKDNEAVQVAAQGRIADRLIGRWTNKSCGERYWEVSKIDDFHYKATFWYQDTGIDGQDEFTVQFNGPVMELHWKIKNPSKTSKKSFYVEKVRDVTEEGYVVFENNYRNFYDAWQVRRCQTG